MRASGTASTWTISGRISPNSSTSVEEGPTSYKYHAITATSPAMTTSQEKKSTAGGWGWVVVWVAGAVIDCESEPPGVTPGRETEITAMRGGDRPAVVLQVSSSKELLAVVVLGLEAEEVVRGRDFLGVTEKVEFRWKEVMSSKEGGRN